MIRQRRFLQLATARCPSSLQYHPARVARSWLCSAISRQRRLSSQKHTIRAFGTSNGKPKTPLVQFSKARLAYRNNINNGIFGDDDSSTSCTVQTSTSDEDDRSAVSLPASSELYLKDFSVFLPNWKDPNETNHKLRNDGGDDSDRWGGIAVVGKNGSGKTLLGKAIIAAGASSEHDPNPYVVSGTVGMPLRDRPSSVSTSAASRSDRHLLGRPGGTPRRRRSPQSQSTTVAHVSFDSHRELLEDRDEKTGEVVTAFKAIASAGNAPGRLNPAARFLVIRFGLYSLLHRTVDTLSTGEIRKVLLARALSTKPSLLILDHAFDGLDAPSRRILRELVSKTIRGFTNDLLVQGISSRDMADKTQVILMAHRAEELDEIRELDAVAWWGKRDGSSSSSSSNEEEAIWNVVRRVYHEDRNDAKDDTTWSTGKEVLHRAMGLNLPTNSSKDTTMDIDWEDPILPSEESVRRWWNRGLVKSHKDDCDSAGVLENNGDPEVLVKAKDLTVQKGDVTLLKSLSWTVRSGERWIVGGGNGAGKSTLSRFLMAAEATCKTEEPCNEALQIMPARDLENPRATIGWVSTESHMQQQQQQQQDQFSNSATTVQEFLLNHSRNASWDDAILPVLGWLGVPVDFPGCFFERPFHKLSQGEQKMVLLAAALAARPSLLILDEPCQGLDLVNRKRLLQVVECICRSTDMAIIYITHHLDEELVPSISHALHLRDRRAVYNGSIEEYSPEEHSGDDNELP